MKHPFEAELPLPLARKLQIAQIAPPERFHATRQGVVALLAHFRDLRLSSPERGMLEVPVVNDWYRQDRSGKLQHYEHLLTHCQPIRAATSVTPEQLKALSLACSLNTSLELATEHLDTCGSDGELVADLLLTHAAQRLTAAVQRLLGARAGSAAHGGLAQRWAAVEALRQLPPAATPLPGGLDAVTEPALADLAAAAAEGPRDLRGLAAAALACPLHDLTCALYRVPAELKLPHLTPNFYHKREERAEQEAARARLCQTVDSHAEVIMRASRIQLYPEYPILAQQALPPEALCEALALKEECAALRVLAAQLRQDAEDHGRLLWLHGRHLIRALLADATELLTKLAAEERDDPQHHYLTVLFGLSSCIEMQHASPPPKLQGQWIRERRRQIERLWRARLSVATSPANP